MAEVLKKKESETPTKKHGKRPNERKKKVIKKVRDYKEGKCKTIDDILTQQAEEFGMKGNEILSTDQMKIILTQIAIGNAKDGLTGLAPTTSERMTAVRQLADMTKSDINGDAIEEHNESIKEFELKNGMNDENDVVPNRNLGDFE